MDVIAVVAIVACWGVVVVTWVVGAVVIARRPRDRDTRGEIDAPGVVAAIGIATILLVAGRRYASQLTITEPAIRLLGLALLVASTAFALRARFELGTSWSVGPRVGGDRRLRTTGVYGIVRHPIYTSLLGMIAGTALLGGGRELLVAVLAGVVIVAFKIRSEERLLLATFPDEYGSYRARVPALVPGLGALRRRLGASGADSG